MTIRGQSTTSVRLHPLEPRKSCSSKVLWRIRAAHRPNGQRISHLGARGQQMLALLRQGCSIVDVWSGGTNGMWIIGGTDAAAKDFHCTRGARHSAVLPCFHLFLSRGDLLPVGASGPAGSFGFKKQWGAGCPRRWWAPGYVLTVTPSERCTHNAGLVGAGRCHNGQHRAFEHPCGVTQWAPEAGQGLAKGWPSS